MLRSTLLVGALVLSTSCSKNTSRDEVVSQIYVHKYGFETSAQDWEARDQDGQVVTTLKNGVTITRSFENGLLHGPTTQTFPNSSIVETVSTYDQGTLLKKRLNDSRGMPIREEAYEFDNQMVVTLWDEKGVPLSVEEYEGPRLIEGKYFTPDHELEAVVTSGQGEKMKRDRSGLLISSELISNGAMIRRTTYHPNGNIHTISNYEQNQLHGTQSKFTASGRPLMELNWKKGMLDGEKVIYRNGYKVAVIPYINGKKNGTELHYDDIGNLTAEIDWKDDKKHGATRLHSEEYTDTEWFFKGQTVNAERFKVLEQRDLMLSDFHQAEIQ